jgi:3-phosphoshikimate 1-carboxyvinyltransferase
MRVEVLPSVLSGRVAAPGSKSDAQRIVACALLARGKTVISAFPDNDDCNAALQVAQDLGAVVTRAGDVVTVKGGFPQAFASGIRNPKNTIDCGESGLASRMFIAIASLFDEPITIKGHSTLLDRPFDDLMDALSGNGVRVESVDGCLPITVCGPLHGGTITLNASVSSQYLTGLLIAASRAAEPTTITVTDLKSKPYVGLTVQILRRFGVDITHNDGFSEFHVQPKAITGVDITVPGDWSGAAFLLVAGALCAESGITVDNLDRESAQADRVILDVLKLAGVRVEFAESSVSVWESEIQAFEFDATDCPDLFPPLAVLAAFANGVCVIKGAGRLMHKESNRAKVIQQEFAKASVRIVVRDDEMKIYPSAIRRAEMLSHRDHRIAMAAAVMGLAGDHVTVKQAESVSKSFPGFFASLTALQARIQIVN